MSCVSGGSVKLVVKMVYFTSIMGGLVSIGFKGDMIQSFKHSQFITVTENGGANMVTHTRAPR